MPERSGDTRDKILEAAKKVFAEMGFGKASVEAIAREAKVSKSLVFWYFKNKKELIQEVVKEVLPRKMIEDCLNKELKGKELLRCVTESYKKLMEDDINKKLVLHLMDLSITDPEYGQLYQEFCEEGLRKMAEKVLCKEVGEREKAVARALHGAFICNLVRGFEDVDWLYQIALNMFKPLGLCN